ncbi:lecithin retinol acyltransferase family protein [Photobacterium kishitanii]|uniref:lecithin retinol acyltransferase family protein n=1 Tax=Photobacterium kishitanii TaxID=318456 RepID=UPI001EFD2D48|nr:lecithin retinol acyltransferase family protein [Photobacterium kishitanii]
MQNVKPGDIVVSDFDLYEHYSVVSDKISTDGKPFLISATKRNGTVKEEPWDIATQEKYTYLSDKQSNLSVAEILSNARSQIGKWRYSLIDSNCEHFSNWCLGLKVSSTQIVGASVGAVGGALLVKCCVEDPKPLDYLFGVVTLGFLGVSCSKAQPKLS